MIVQQGCCPLCGRQQELWPPYLDPGGPPHGIWQDLPYPELPDYWIECSCELFGALRSVWLDLEEHLLGAAYV